MATIDGFLLGGRPESPSDTDYGAGIAYRLRAPCQVSRSDEIDGWTVESAAGKSTIVARSPQPVDRRQAIAEGTESIQRYLDLLSYERFKVSELDASVAVTCCSIRRPIAALWRSWLLVTWEWVSQ